MESIDLKSMIPISAGGTAPMDSGCNTCGPRPALTPNIGNRGPSVSMGAGQNPRSGFAKINLTNPPIASTQMGQKPLLPSSQSITQLTSQTQPATQTQPTFLKQSTQIPRVLVGSNSSLSNETLAPKFDEMKSKLRQQFQIHHGAVKRSILDQESHPKNKEDAFEQTAGHRQEMEKIRQHVSLPSNKKHIENLTEQQKKGLDVDAKMRSSQFSDRQEKRKTQLSMTERSKANQEAALSHDTFRTMTESLGNHTSHIDRSTALLKQMQQSLVLNSAMKKSKADPNQSNTNNSGNSSGNNSGNSTNNSGNNTNNSGNNSGNNGINNNNITDDNGVSGFPDLGENGDVSKAMNKQQEALDVMKYTMDQIHKLKSVFSDVGSETQKFVQVGATLSDLTKTMVSIQSDKNNYTQPLHKGPLNAVFSDPMSQLGSWVSRSVETQNLIENECIILRVDDGADLIVSMDDASKTTDTNNDTNTNTEPAAPLALVKLKSTRSTTKANKTTLQWNKVLIVPSWENTFLICGTYGNPNTGSLSACVARFVFDSSNSKTLVPDPTFFGGGMKNDFFSTPSQAVDICVQYSSMKDTSKTQQRQRKVNRIFVLINVSASSKNKDFACLVAILPSGELDKSFGAQGYEVIQFPHSLGCIGQEISISDLTGDLYVLCAVKHKETKDTKEDFGMLPSGSIRTEVLRISFSSVPNTISRLKVNPSTTLSRSKPVLGMYQNLVLLPQENPISTTKDEFVLSGFLPFYDSKHALPILHIARSLQAYENVGSSLPSDSKLESNSKLESIKPDVQKETKETTKANDTKETTPSTIPNVVQADETIKEENLLHKAVRFVNESTNFIANQETESTPLGQRLLYHERNHDNKHVDQKDKSDLSRLISQNVSNGQVYPFKTIVFQDTLYVFVNKFASNNSCDNSEIGVYSKKLSETADTKNGFGVDNTNGIVINGMNGSVDSTYVYQSLRPDVNGIVGRDVHLQGGKSGNRSVRAAIVGHHFRIANQRDSAQPFVLEIDIVPEEPKKVSSYIPSVSLGVNILYPNPTVSKKPGHYFHFTVPGSDYFQSLQSIAYSQIEQSYYAVGYTQFSKTRFSRKAMIVSWIPSN